MRIRSLLLAGLLAVPVTGIPAQEPAIPDPSNEYRTAPLASLHLGFAAIELAENTAEYGGLLDLGAIPSEALHLVFEFNYLRSETKRTTSTGQPISGRFRDISVSGDLRLQPYRMGSAIPYLAAGLGLHFRSNDLNEANAADLYDGLAVGLQGGLGVLVDLDESGRFGVTGEVRRVVAQNLDRTSLRGGVFLRF